MDAFPVSRAAEVVGTDHGDDYLTAVLAVGDRGRQRNPGDRRRRLMLSFLEKARLISGDREAPFAKQEQNAYVALPSPAVVARAARASSRPRRPSVKIDTQN
jgi:hypothetical protein